MTDTQPDVAEIEEEVGDEDSSISMTVAARKKSHAKKQRALDKARAAETLDYSGELTEEHLSHLTPNEIRAMATDRGYPVVAGGRKRVTAMFLRHQDMDVI